MQVDRRGNADPVPWAYGAAGKEQSRQRGLAFTPGCASPNLSLHLGGVDA